MKSPFVFTFKRAPLRVRLRNWLWRSGLIELPFWQEPEVPVIRGDVLRAILDARNYGRP